MDKPNSNKDKLIQSAIQFMESFESVFHHDWQHTKNAINDSSLISDSGTFCCPNVEDTHDNWSSRGALIEAYQEFSRLLKEQESGENTFN